MLDWLFRTSRIEHFEIKLAGAKAAYEEEIRMAKASGEMYPMVMQKLAREIAECEEKLKQLRGNNEHTAS